MQILLANAWHDDNKGDAAITITTLALVRRMWPAASIRVTSLLEDDGSGPDGMQHAFRHVRAADPEAELAPSPCPAPPAATASGVAALARGGAWLGRLARAYGRLVFRPAAVRRALGNPDRVVLVGGSNVFASGRTLGAARLAQVLFPALAARRLGVPSLFLGHTVGPLRGWSSRVLARLAFGGCREVVVRDPKSGREVLSLGVPADAVFHAPDIALGLMPDVSPRVRALLDRHGLHRGRFLALVVRRDPYRTGAAGERLLAELSAFGRRVLAEGQVDELAVVAQTLGPTPIEDDRGPAVQLARRIGGSTPVITADLSPAELAGLYGEAAAVVSIRLHGAVLAIAGGTPAVAISYFTSKAEGVMENLGMDAQHLESDEVTADRLFALVVPLLGEDGRRRARAAADRARQDVLALAGAVR